MTAEDIVRRLAADGPLPREDGACSLCADTPTDADYARHAPDCLYRLACEWVAEEERKAKAARHCEKCGHRDYEHRCMGSGSTSSCSWGACRCIDYCGYSCDCGDATSHPGQPKPTGRATITAQIDVDHARREQHDGGASE